MSSGSVPDPLPQPERMLVHNADVCVGCGICELSCSMSHQSAFSRSMVRLKLHRNYYRGQWDGTGQFRVDVCQQCPWPECLYACPTGALRLDPQTNARVIDPEVCIGCQRCLRACPYDMITFDGARGVCIKCDLCGGDPECVKQCPASGNGALQVVERRGAR
jgi:carbon-monoxide dehydrogenase iron sulfur subunit